MDILNGAIDSLLGSSNKEDWTPVALNVADATVTISKEKVSHTFAIAELLPQTSPVFFHSVLSSFLCRKLKNDKTNSIHKTVLLISMCETTKMVENT